jgi:hypothetical protein
MRQMIASNLKNGKKSCRKLWDMESTGAIFVKEVRLLVKKRLNFPKGSFAISYPIVTIEP